MTTTELIKTLKVRQVELRVDGGRLRYRAPKGVLTDELATAIRRYKAELIAMLSSDKSTLAKVKPKIKPRSERNPQQPPVPIKDLTWDELITNIREVAAEISALPVVMENSNLTQLRTQLQTLEAKRDERASGKTKPKDSPSEPLSVPSASKAAIQAWLDRDTYATFHETLAEWQKAILAETPHDPLET